MEEFKKKPLKILMTTDTVGGVWTYCIELCKSLQNYNAYIFLVTMGAKLNAGQRKEVNELYNTEVLETNYALEWMCNPWNDINRSGEELLELERQIRPDIIHLNCYAYGALPWKAPVIMVAHSDVFSWWHAVHNEEPPAAWDTYFKKVKEGLNSATSVIAPSRNMLNCIREIYSLHVPSSVVYNARNKNLFHRGIKHPYIFSSGRIWDDAKNISLLVRAAAHIPYPVRIAGERNFDDKYFRDSHHVHFTGKLNTTEMAEQLSHASIYVHPAKYEPFGLSVLEAALSGCALILSDIPTLREIWQDNALYVNSRNAFELADKINLLMDDEEMRLQYADKAYRHAQTFSSEKFSKEYMTAYMQAKHNQTEKVLA